MKFWTKYCVFCSGRNAVFWRKHQRICIGQYGTHKYEQFGLVYIFSVFFACVQQRQLFVRGFIAISRRRTGITFEIISLRFVLIYSLIWILQILTQVMLLNNGSLLASNDDNLDPAISDFFGLDHVLNTNVLDKSSIALSKSPDDQSTGNVSLPILFKFVKMLLNTCQSFGQVRRNFQKASFWIHLKSLPARR